MERETNLRIHFRNDQTGICKIPETCKSLIQFSIFAAMYIIQRRNPKTVPLLSQYNNNNILSRQPLHNVCNDEDFSEIKTLFKVLFKVYTKF